MSVQMVHYYGPGEVPADLPDSAASRYLQTLHALGPSRVALARGEDGRVWMVNLDALSQTAWNGFGWEAEGPTGTDLALARAGEVFFGLVGALVFLAVIGVAFACCVGSLG
jgi:hypothetical protein